MIRSPKLRVLAPAPEGQTDREPDALEGRVAQGLRLAMDLGSEAHTAARTLTNDLYATIELLIAKGVIGYRELDERKRALAADGQSVVTLEMRHEPDKYAVEAPVAINCAERYHLCQAACCKLTFGLTNQDLDEGVLRWDYTRPYRIRQREDGYCAHNDPDSRGCTVYEQRPAVCRTYSCREDKRIWLDFENMIVNPELAK